MESRAVRKADSAIRRKEMLLQHVKEHRGEQQRATDYRRYQIRLLSEQQHLAKAICQELSRMIPRLEEELAQLRADREKLVQAETEQ